MGLQVAPLPGGYLTSDAFIVCKAFTELSGTDWSEQVSGTNFYLSCDGADGNAIEEILHGKALFLYGPAGSSQSYDTNIAGSLNDNSTPAIKWLYSGIAANFYKVIAVLNDNLIQVEAFLDVGIPFVLIGCATAGYDPSSISITADSGSQVDVVGYVPSHDKISIVIAQNETKVIPMNIDTNGPLYINGNGMAIINFKKPWQ